MPQLLDTDNETAELAGQEEGTAGPTESRAGRRQHGLEHARISLS